MGIPAYNAECRSIVMRSTSSLHFHISIGDIHCRYAGEWERTITRLGRWIDFEKDYKTMNLPFMETEWYATRPLFFFFDEFVAGGSSSSCSTRGWSTEASR